VTFTPPTEDEWRALGARIDGAAASAKDVYELTTRLGVTEEERNGVVGLATMAFQYGTNRDPGGTSSYFTRMFGYENGSQYPPFLTDVPDDLWDLWDRLAGIVTEPLAQARLHDLCFCGRRENVGDHAREAASGYLRAAAALRTSEDDQQKAVIGLRQSEYLRRARAIGRLTRREDVSDDAATAIVAAIKSIDETEPFDVGSAIAIADSAVDEELPDSAIDDLLDRLATETRDIFFTERVIRLQLRRASDDNLREALQRKLVEAWIDEADRSDPSRRVWNLTTAGERARDFGLSDLQATITRRLQQTELADHGLVRRRVTVPVDQAQAEAYVQAFVDLPSWRDALLALLVGNPPTGDVARNRMAAEAMVTNAPLASSVPQVLLGGDGLPKVTMTTEEEKREWRLTRCETSQLQVLGSLTDEILRRIGVKWAPIPEDELTALLSAEAHASTAGSAALARAFNHYFNCDFEAAAYIAAPQVERIVREAVLAVDEPAYRLQRGNTPGQYAGLGALLPVLLKAGVSESWIRFIQTVLCAPIGMNYRNELLHGFVDDVYSGNAALILLAGLYLSRGIFVSVAGASAPEEDE
jgi:hypothetical protein